MGRKEFSVEGVSKLKKSGSPGAQKSSQMHKCLIIRYDYCNDGTSGLLDFSNSDTPPLK
jgi:hypothetical protein